MTADGCLTNWDPAPLTLESLYDTFARACKDAWDDGRREVSEVMLPVCVLDGLSGLCNPVTRSVVHITRVPLFALGEHPASPAEAPAAEIPAAPLLDKDTVTALLRECVTVVRPGEVLVIRIDPDDDFTPNQMHEIAQALYHAAEDRGIKAMLVLGHEMAVAEPVSVTGQWTDKPAWLRELRWEHYLKGMCRLTHEPTGKFFEVPAGQCGDGSYADGVRTIGAALVESGDISINDGRRAMGLEPWQWTEAAGA